MIKFRFATALLACCLIILTGCGKKAETSSSTTTPPPPPSALSRNLLDDGKGAVLVVFPKPQNFDRNQWMTQIQLEGNEPTDRLPMLPIADLQAGMVLNVPPGSYQVIATGWMRRDPPAAGGSLDRVVVNAGEVVTLQASNISNDEFPYPNTSLTIKNRNKWTLQNPAQLQEFIAGIID